MNRRLFSLLCLGVLLSLASSLGDERRDLIAQAFVLTRQASKPEHGAERAELLAKALLLTREVPHEHLGGHRAKASKALSTALNGLHDGKPEPAVRSAIEQVLEEFETCAELLAISLSGLPPVEHPADADPSSPPTSDTPKS